MPVFIALSGSIFALKEYSFGQLISKKCKRLLIPFFCSLDFLESSY